LARLRGAEAVYEVADLFRQRCLIEGKSLLWPSETAWTADNLKALYDAFMGALDEGEDTFYEKWERQLADLPPTVHRIAADVIAFYHLFPNNITVGRKLTNVEKVLSWKLTEDRPDLERLRIAFSTGIGRAGRSYLLHRPWQIAF
jgi:5-methylcytosine-specific restriction enzyme B